MRFAGIDLGTRYIKTHSGLIFPSGISKNICLSNNVMHLEGTNYAMELMSDKADYDININKSLNRNVRVNFIYALTKLCGDNKLNSFRNVVVGLPGSQWKNENTVNQFKEILALLHPTLVKVNGTEYLIEVNNIDIVPEGAPAYYAINYLRFGRKRVLFVDIGSLTINSILFDNDEIVDLHTDEFGILKVYKDMAEKLTSVFGFNVLMDDMHSNLLNGFFLKGEKIDIKEYIKNIALEHSEKIYKSLKIKWSVDTIPFVVLIGAGSIPLINYLKEYIPHVELLENPQMLSAIGMGQLAGEDE